ncbi:hypothetical protein HYPSUDRAFT_204620 [Hypholoma sublateritium FD-334 SS-4]|uniref:Uncharacterized protein n=1 Tax=Hypholoma sublateritium (strain FD-334 SS-4) TaxID=945553 RepID=A0A0D2M804_HYPSF|nr:hypothetical protein HYPSUDRAFT_204620 [Hypholoma sublateritium FD-334 SS-4]
MALNIFRSLIPSTAAGDIEMNDLESGGSRTAVTHLPANSSRGQPHTSASMDVGPDSQQLHSATPAGQLPAPHFIRPSQPALQLAPVQRVPPQHVPPQPNLNHHIPAPQPVPPQPIPPPPIPPPPIPPHTVPPQLIPPHDIPPQPTSQVRSGAIAQPIPAQPNALQLQQSTTLPFRFILQDPPLPYIFGSAANHQSADTSEIVPHLGKRNRLVDEDPKKIRVIRNPSPQLLNEIRSDLSKILEVQQKEQAENLESRIQMEFDRRQEQIDAQGRLTAEMFNKERALLEEAQKRAELVVNENAEAEARRRAEDEAQRRARDQEQTERLAEALARAERAEAMLSKMESKMEWMMNAMSASAPHSSTVAGPSIVHAASGPEEGGNSNPTPMDLYAETSIDTGPSVARTVSFSVAGGDPNPATPRPSVAQTIPAPVAGGDPNPAAMDLYIDSTDNYGAPSLPIESAGRSAGASDVEGTSAVRGKGKRPVHHREDAYDGDDDEDESDESDEDDDMGEVASALHGEHQGDVNPRVRAVPPPRKHTAPRGGGGSDQITMPSSQIEPQPTSTFGRVRTRTGANWMSSIAGVYGGAGAAEQDATPQAPRNRTKKMARAFRKTTLKGFNPVKATKQTGVRRVMNELMGIEKYKDIINKRYATVAEVDKFIHESEGDPGLDPMRPYFEEGGYNTWNDRLCKKFANYYEEKLDLNFSVEDREEVEDHFMSRINRLGRKWRKARTKTELERIEEEKRLMKASRATTRRLTLYDDRREICAGNILNPDGSLNMAWTFLSNMLEKLGAVGMSSDESEQENGRTVYVVKKREWRSEDITRLLMFIDKDRNATNATGGARPGNPPQKRKRFVTNPRVSKRDPSLRCPLNYYNQVFYANLTNRECSVYGCNTFVDPVSGRPGRSLHARELKAHGVAQALAAAQTTLAAAQIPSVRHKANADAAAAVDAQLEVITAHLASQTLGDKIATTSSSVHSSLADQEAETATEAQIEDITAQLASQTLADNVSGPSGNPLWSRDVSQDPKASSSSVAPKLGATSHATLSADSTSISTPSTPSRTHEDKVIRAQSSVDSLPLTLNLP